MTSRRTSDEVSYLDERSQTDTEVLTLGNAGHHQENLPKSRRRQAEPSSGDERISLFWRVFGGTIFSIVALALVTVYNNLNATITELRNEVSRANEARSELVKKEEFNSRTQSFWNKLQEVQELRGMLTGMKDQMGGLTENRSEQKSMIERVSVFEQRLKSAEEQHKTLSQTQSMIYGLEQKLAAREAQNKSLEDDRKDLCKQVLELRERLAKLETMVDYKPMSKIPASKD
ncbi:AAA family ATPase [Zavarzinella formosa]|uniref:hypothetical protein n=1 Tax=Zavarzinella formosa TaxID=360055 RepID=UPI000317431C|nr:hypothetical protein [Zavarzinella formosa]